MNTEKETGMSSLVGASARELADTVVRILDEKKARDIKLLKFAEGNDLTEYFVICTGTSNTQIKGLAGELEYKLSERGVRHTLQWNVGNHFQDAEKRCADGFAWCMAQRKAEGKNT